MREEIANIVGERPIWFKLLVALGAISLMALSAIVTYAQAGGGFDLSWSTIDGGGATFSTGGSFSLGGTVGQFDAGTSSGGAFTLNGGFWDGSVAAPTDTSTPTATATRSPTRTATRTATRTFTPIPTRTPTQAALLVGHLTWQGRPAQPNVLQQVAVTLTLKAGTTESNYPVQTTDASGFLTVSVSALPAGTYNWRVKDPKYLASAGSVVLAGAAQTNAEMGLVKAGDANNDNLVTILDFNILKATFGKGNGDPGYDDRSDFDGNLLVNVQDFNLLKQNFGTGGAPPIRAIP
jgi:hypothetical protein